MDILGEANRIIENDKDNIDSYYWEYNINKNDFFLSYKPTWQHLSTTAYTFELKGVKVTIPSGMYLLIGDLVAGVDFIKVEEIVGRNFDAFMFHSTLETGEWTLEPIEFVAQHEEYHQVFPFTKNCVAVAVGKKYGILVSPIDSYSKIKQLDVHDII